MSFELPTTEETFGIVDDSHLAHICMSLSTHTVRTNKVARTHSDEEAVDFNVSKYGWHLEKLAEYQAVGEWLNKMLRGAGR